MKRCSKLLFTVCDFRTRTYTCLLIFLSFLFTSFIDAPQDAPPPVPPKPTSLSNISPDPPLPPKPTSLSKNYPDPLPPKPTSLSKNYPDPLPPKPISLSKISPDPEDYEKMGPSGAASQVTAKKTKSKPKPLTDEEKVLTRPFTKYLPDPLLIYYVLL